MRFSSRKLQIGDVFKWKALLKELSTDKEPKGDIKNLVADPNFFGLVAETEGFVVGFGSISFYQSSIKGLVGVIEDIIVAKGYRQKGLGAFLFDSLLKEALDRDVNCITLTSSPERIKARELYESRGFALYDTGFFIKQS